MSERIESVLERGRRSLRVLQSAGLLDPGFVFSMGESALRYGASIATGIAASERRRPHALAIVDDAGEVTFRELLHRIFSIAGGLAAAGVGPRHNVAILCRNHRGFVEATAAASALGADTLFLNTGFAGPQLGEVLDREGADSIIYDEEFEEIVDAHAGARERFIAWHESPTAVPTLEELVRLHPATPPKRAMKPGGATILTSGTTGTPKGAARDSTTADLASALGVLEALPVRVGATTLVAAPAFHAWGLTQSMLGILFGARLILHRRFDPLRTVEAIERNRVENLAVVPVMMQRILALGREQYGGYDVSSLRATLSSGSALPGELAIAWMDDFGDLYNFYGSTEVAQATCAGPADLRAAPGTAGRIIRGSTVAILDEEGREVPQGTTGRIFVGNASQFGGYTGGGGKEMIDGLMSIGDVGYFDAEGRLFVEGRDDDMIVSGGENVFPKEVEDLLSDQPEVLEAAVIGVADDEFGQRLRAFVVRAEGAALDEDGVRQLVKSQLARHKVPRDVVFLDEIPRNPTGKILKRVLREHP